MPTLGNTPRPAYVYDTETDTWVPVGVGAHTHSDIPNTLVDAKGDLITATADNVPARLAKGADGTILVSDSTTSTGLAWQPYGAIQSAGKNKVINGDFAVNQRNFTSITATSTYCFDRFQTATLSGTTTYTPQTFTPGTAPVSGYEAKNFLRMDITGQTATNSLGAIQHRIEDVRTFAGQTVTVSFWAKAASGTPFIVPWFQQMFGTGGSPGLSFTNATKQAITTSWQRYSFTVAIPSIAEKTVGATDSYLNILITGSAGPDRASFTDSIGIQTNIFDIWGVQLEAGSIATPFQTATGTIQGELAACQRYYWRTSYDSTYGAFGNGIAYSTTAIRTTIVPPVQMRISPSSLEYGGTNPFWSWDGVNNSFSATAPTLQSGYYGTRGLIGVDFTGFSGLTQFRPYIVGHGGSGNSNQYIGFSAEL